MRVMLVEDSATMRKMLKNALSKHGVQDVIEAGSGAEAFRKLDGQDVPDVILLDWHLPDTDGISMTKTFKADESLKDVPIIMVTSETSKAKIMEALSAGVSTFVSKPFTDDTLWEKVERVIGE